ncbi:FAD-dependent oxidoreductase [Secundilactobacillus paracollinoides]|uniref:Urocanate reductase n=1 Tax=Secundilactobacillus paracollinoides TaxID=240427 RepID=A0A1B2IW61_9LACO|nr:FAD-dependent oxidoreductase [Secundilactobacillus paracollinoides]ANZ60433.1 fumarate reductase [Secundilactobacillus paracollinoides]ANZ66261.1 fumarate reductase [Secundilactobacillus paracollinoides]KRL76675.1 fumarate reductase, flavoprotein subunit precursor [Secundilactobacillus paracollinoides DSM 15502 = JCM 11969]
MSNEKQIKGSAMGHNGIINYELDVNDNKLEDLKILKHSETSGIFNQVIDKLKANIIEQQSFDVDAISGATVMTQAILDSAKEAVADDKDVKLTPKPKKEVTHVTTRLKADVVIIGGGEAGLVAGARALTEGQSVILVEKNGYMGGATILNGSNVVGTGSKVSEKALGHTEDTPVRLAQDVARESRETNLTDLTKLMANNIGPAIDFISDFADLHYQKAQTQTPEHSVERQIELPTASSFEFISKVSKAFQDKGGKIILGARVEDMTENSKGEVIGLVAEAKNETFKIKAHSIVLASGGYGANQKMRGAESEGIDYYGPMTSTGDAYSFNKDLNLKSHNMGWYKIYPHGVETEPGIAKLTTYASKEATDLGALYVNSKGKRIVNESAVYTDFRDAILQQPDRMSYMLMDERTWKEVYKLLVLHDFTEKEIKQFFDNKDKEPLFVKGSLEEVAAAAHVDVAGLEETVKNYQGYAKAGKDPEFDRQPEYLHAFEGDTFYMVEQRGRFATTLGGYSVNADKMQLVNTDDQPIANYYAAGEVVGGANGHDSMPSMMNSWGISSGYVAGEAASENANRLKAAGPDAVNLVALVGTNASKSYNRKLLTAMQDLFDTQADIDLCEIKELPLFNEDLVNDEPENVKAFGQKIDDADGVIIGVPEYDHAVPAALKSAIEWLSCAEHPFTGKPVMIVGTSLGIQGTVRAQMNLRQILDAPGVDAEVMPGNEFMLPQAGTKFEDNGTINDPGSVSFLKQCFGNFVQFIALKSADEDKKAQEV